ncbi:DUF2243 domain-containing protein [Paenibacillus hamazuiensis]|uniref:DUF2243 domain-containing protein n=1 Tax=Paenibacillus hamazuiensis TaxID=2936508 RepID=UPI00200D110B|nr:DUF2243 domain-containing protein [Paenibacillus hamazuiensis]
MSRYFHDLRRHPTLKGAFLLGIGAVGMLDGIVFHQILQWHSTYMHTDRHYQIVSDGLFHLAVTAIILWGAIVLWNGGRNRESGSRRLFVSGLLSGAGCFNFAEGIVSHHLLQIHHVKPGEFQTAYDLAFDACGLVMLLAGIALYRSLRQS